jgi:hypothetical protein
MSRRAPADHCGLYASVRRQASPRTLAPLAKKRNDVRADVIFAKDLQRPISRRRSFMIEVVDTFLSSCHAENLSRELVSEMSVMRGQNQLGLCAVDIQYFRIVGKSHRYRNGDRQPASAHRVS